MSCLVVLCMLQAFVDVVDCQVTKHSNPALPLVMHPCRLCLKIWDLCNLLLAATNMTLEGIVHFNCNLTASWLHGVDVQRMWSAMHRALFTKAIQATVFDFDLNHSAFPLSSQKSQKFKRTKASLSSLHTV